MSGAMQLCEDEPFLELLECVRRGDLERVSALVTNFGVPVNCVDRYDYSPLILASLCGHIDVVKYLLEHGAILERDTFDGARCLYGALNDRIRNLLLAYDASTEVDVLQPFAAHLSAIWRKTALLDTSDIVLTNEASNGVASDSSNDAAAGDEPGAVVRYAAHRFLLAARCKHLAARLAPGGVWHNTRRAQLEPSESTAAAAAAFEYVLRWLYVDVRPIGLDPSELCALPHLCKELELEGTPFLQTATSNGTVPSAAGIGDGPVDAMDRRKIRQEQSRAAQDDLDAFVTEHVIAGVYEIDVDADADGSELKHAARKAFEQDRRAFADCLLAVPLSTEKRRRRRKPNGSTAAADGSDSIEREGASYLVYPVNKAMLIRSEYYLLLFTSRFAEAQEAIPVLQLDVAPQVAEIVLRFLYTDRAQIPRRLALDVLHAAAYLLMDKERSLKSLAAIVLTEERSDVNTAGAGRAAMNGTAGTTTIANGYARGSADNVGGSRVSRSNDDVDENETILHNGGEQDNAEDDDDDDGGELPPGTDIYAILRAGWATSTRRLEEYAARYLARHLDGVLWTAAFAAAVQESASRIAARQQTDTIELVDDVRYYLGQLHGIYLEMEPADRKSQLQGKAVEHDAWVGLTEYEVAYNEKLAALDDVLASLDLDA